MVHYVKPKKAHINGLNFLQTPRNLILEVFWGFFSPPNEFFSEKSGSVTVLSLRHRNLICHFIKILLAVFEKKK